MPVSSASLVSFDFHAHFQEINLSVLQLTINVVATILLYDGQLASRTSLVPLVGKVLQRLPLFFVYIRLAIFRSVLLASLSFMPFDLAVCAHPPFALVALHVRIADHLDVE